MDHTFGVVSLLVLFGRFSSRGLAFRSLVSGDLSVESYCYDRVVPPQSA